MNRYYCPYCPPSYKLVKKKADGVLVCGQCGDPLIKAKIIKPTQIFALIVTFSFITPLILMLLVFLKDLKRQDPSIEIGPKSILKTSIIQEGQ